MTSFYTRAFAFGIFLIRLEIAFGDNPTLYSHSEMQSHSIVGCMTTACHGSNVPTTKTWQRAGKIWFDQDPHARAYTSLLTDASAKIVSRLVNEELKPSSTTYRDILNARCVSCHANENAPEEQRVLGADCQVCHGNADAWGSEHYSSEWKALGKSRFDNTKKFNVESLVSRAQVCSSCHIGELNRNSGLNVALDREVDHRLMAAGHPPMHFDFEGYLRRYPVHWDMQNEPIGLGSPIGFERWRTGKVMAAITKLNLLAARAERSTDKNARAVSDWPELTEYNCTSCHHPLEQPSWRLARGGNAIAVWDDWGVSQLDCAVRHESAAELESQLTTLKHHAEQLVPEPRQVAMNATALRRWLEIELDHVSSPAENSVELMLRKLKSRMENVPKIRNWESSTQWYIATRVLSEGLGIVSLQETVPFVSEDPFLGFDKTWKPSSSQEFNTPKLFHPDMLKKYSNDLMQQLRTRP